MVLLGPLAGFGIGAFRLWTETQESADASGGPRRARPNPRMQPTGRGCGSLRSEDVGRHGK
jgi:hypothetical protein